MLSSIHPLGERARDNHWSLTITSFTLASAAAGAVFGLILAAAGSVLIGQVSAGLRVGIVAVAALVAGAMDMLRLQPMGPERQVNETWIGHYRGWVYGGAFGLQLGVGAATYVVTWGVYAVFVAEFAAAEPITGAAVGAVFGFGRAIALLLAGWVDRPSRLSSFHRRMARLGPPVHRTAATTLALVGVYLLGSAL